MTVRLAGVLVPVGRYLSVHGSEVGAGLAGVAVVASVIQGDVVKDLARALDHLA
jgi:hypothetical protein